jgi:hypothetical protein
VTALRQQLIRSLAIEGVKPVFVQPVALSERYWSLHRKCAAGTITEDEAAELELMCAEKEREADEERL